VPLLAEWHQHHERTTRNYRARIGRGEQPVIAALALLECYSVLTRLPHPVRTPPDIAEQVLTRYFADVEVAGLAPDTGWRAIRSLAALELGGGRIYDAAIAFTVAGAGASVLLTWNVKRSLTLAPPGLEIQQP
jgi:uncharacterized protein with PIN domain